MAIRNIETVSEEIVIKEPAVKKRIVSVIAALGVIATGLGVVAEITRTKVRCCPTPLCPVRLFISSYKQLTVINHTSAVIYRHFAPPS